MFGSSRTLLKHSWNFRRQALKPRLVRLIIKWDKSSTQYHPETCRRGQGPLIVKLLLLCYPAFNDLWEERLKYLQETNSTRVSTETKMVERAASLLLAAGRDYHRYDTQGFTFMAGGLRYALMTFQKVGGKYKLTSLELKTY